jgi:hypothetical protein
MFTEKPEEAVEPVVCGECGAPAQILTSEFKSFRYDVRCTDPMCHRDFDCRRTRRDKAVKFWNKIQTAKAAGTYKPKVNVTAEMDDPTNVARCPKCNLILPCNDCIKPLDFYAVSRHASYDPPSARLR